MTAGRTDVTRRALERVVAAAAASVLETPARDVAVRLADDRGALRVAVDAAVAIRRDAGLITRAASWRSELAGRASELTGLTISTVDLRLTAVPSTPPGQKGRVR